MTQMALGDLKKWKMYQIRSHAYVWTKSQKLVFSVPFWPFLVHFWSKWIIMAPNYFFWILRPNDFQGRVICLCLNKISKLVFSVRFCPFSGPFLVQNGSKWPKINFTEFWGQTISNEGSHAYVWKKLEKMIFSVPFWPFLAPKIGWNGAKNQFLAKQKILPLELPTMMPETPKKMGELTLGTLTAGMTTAWTDDGRTDAAMMTIPFSEG